eukprot:6924028-Karenia_brevis.AAC.1
MQKPEREPPFVLNNPDDLVAMPHRDFDWTLTVNNDTGLEHRRREIRNVMIRDTLLSGKNVVYRSTGWSLHPIMSSGDNTYWAPVTKDEDVQEKDIVFCCVQKSQRYYGHIV